MSTLRLQAREAARDSKNSKVNASAQMESAPMRMQEEPVAETPLLGSHFEPEHDDAELETPQAKGRVVPPITLANESVEQKGSTPPPQPPPQPPRKKVRFAANS